MDDDLKTLLEENIRISKDNNRMLRTMKRAAVAGVIGRVIFWILILGVPAYLYITYLSPLISSIMQHGGVVISKNPFLRLLGLPSSGTLERVLHTVASTTRGI